MERDGRQLIPTGGGTSNDLDLAIIDTDGSTVLFETDSDSGNPYGEGFCYAVAASGTYYVRVRDIGGTTIGTYEVMVANTTQNIPVELMSIVVD